MRAHPWHIGVACLALGGAAGCEPTDPLVNKGQFSPEYMGIQTRLLDGDLVGFLVEMSGARDKSDVVAYSECAAAQYALIRGYGFARHVRTNVVEEAGLWRADAVYTISPALPRGMSTIDAEVTVSNCTETGIPTV